MSTRRPLVAQFLSGLGAYLRVPRTLFRRKLWRFQLLPALISLVLSVALFVAFYMVAGKFSIWMDDLIKIPWEWLDKAVTMTTAVLSFIVLIAGYFFVHKHLVLIVLSPFLGKIAEETLIAVKGEDFVKSKLGTKEAVARSVKINLHYIVRELFFNFGFLIAGLAVPFVGPAISGVGMFLTQSRFLGYGLMDFPLENRGLTVAESDTFVKKRHGMSIGLGTGYLLLMMIPVVGWMFAPTFGAVAGTLKAIEELETSDADSHLS